MSEPDTGTPPTIPADLQQYNSYVIDPEWQRKFTLIWCCILAGTILLSLRRLVHAIKTRRAFIGISGIGENWDMNRDAPYVPVDKLAASKSNGGRNAVRRVQGVLSALGSVWLWTLPGLGLNLGQLLVVIVYFLIVLFCIMRDAQLVDNSNRAGFLALAQLPPVFLFATKNSILSLLFTPGYGYEKLNFIHRWSGRCLFLGGCIHGALWIRNHLEWDLPIIGPQKETSGVACLGLLCVIVLSSLRPVRRFAWQIFFFIHVLAFVAFYVTVCYHTIYATPWIFPPLALYGLDILMRLLKYRIKDATLEAIDSQMTLIRVPYCDSGWLAGQHVRLRVFFSGRILESHPLTILNATPETSCLSPNACGAASGGGLIFGARSVGDWTRALNDYTRRLMDEHARNLEVKCPTSEVPIQVMIDGPYGGSSIDLGQYERVLLFAGGSGATFMIGMLDDIVGRCVRRGRRLGEKTKRIEFAWCIRSYGAIQWFSAMLMDIAQAAAEPNSGLDLHLTIFVTCLCNPEAVPSIPNLDVVVSKPSASGLLEGLLTPVSSLLCDDDLASAGINALPSTPEGPSVSVPPASSKLENDKYGSSKGLPLGGGMGVCAAGPESLTRATSNAVAKLSMMRGIELGGIDLHTEVYAI